MTSARSFVASGSWQWLESFDGSWDKLPQPKLVSLPDFWNHQFMMYLTKYDWKPETTIPMCCFWTCFSIWNHQVEKKEHEDFQKILWECTVPNTVVIKKTALRRVNHKWNCTVFYPPKKEGNNWIIPELLLMVQKSGDHHLACTKPIVNI